MIYRDTVTRKELIDGIELLRSATMEESEESALLERLERGGVGPGSQRLHIVVQHDSDRDCTHRGNPPTHSAELMLVQSSTLLCSDSSVYPL